MKLQVRFGGKLALLCKWKKARVWYRLEKVSRIYNFFDKITWEKQDKLIQCVHKKLSTTKSNMNLKLMSN